MMDLKGMKDIQKISVFILLFSCLLLKIHSSSFPVEEDFEAYASANLSSSIQKLVQVFNQSKMGGEGASRKCNLFKGSWVQDNSYPLYTEGECPFVDYKLSCRENGRPDGGFQKWRWKPHACEMPRFNAIDMMERMRGKRLMFVGDSISQSQWESLVCLLYPFVKQSTQRRLQEVASKKGSVRQFKIPEYKASIDFFWAPLLVEVSVSESGKKVMDLDSLRKYEKQWENVDILVFETSHWWEHVGSLRSWDEIKLDGRLFEANDDPLWAYRKALITWSNWVTQNLDPAKNIVFFRTMSPIHIDIGLDKEYCYNKVKPIKKTVDDVLVPPQVGIVKRIMKRMRYPVRLLDITRLSSYRIDGHPSIYRKLVSGSEMHDPQVYSDCSHWCLPGVPDTWNELLYASLIMN